MRALLTLLSLAALAALASAQAPIVGPATVSVAAGESVTVDYVIPAPLNAAGSGTVGAVPFELGKLPDVAGKVSIRVTGKVVGSGYFVLNAGSAVLVTVTVTAAPAAVPVTPIGPIPPPMSVTPMPVAPAPSVVPPVAPPVAPPKMADPKNASAETPSIADYVSKDVLDRFANPRLAPPPVKEAPAQKPIVKNLKTPVPFVHRPLPASPATADTTARQSTGSDIGPAIPARRAATNNSFGIGISATASTRTFAPAIGLSGGMGLAAGSGCATATG